MFHCRNSIKNTSCLNLSLFEKKKSLQSLKYENRKSPHISDRVSTYEIFLIKNYRTCILGYGYKRCEDIFSLQASSVTGNGNQLKWFEVSGISDILTIPLPSNSFLSSCLSHLSLTSISSSSSLFPFLPIIHSISPPFPSLSMPQPSLSSSLISSLTSLFLACNPSPLLLHR